MIEADYEILEPQIKKIKEIVDSAIDFHELADGLLGLDLPTKAVGKLLGDANALADLMGAADVQNKINSHGRAE